MSKIVNDKRYFRVYKPFGYLSQFSGEKDDKLLGDLYNFPKDVYPVGRLDKDSEGLLLLTNDNNFKNKSLDPLSKTPKTYFVQVDGEITEEAIRQLTAGTLTIKHKGKQHKVAKAICKRINTPKIPDRIPPVRYRKSIPTSWISLTIYEGKNRQVRKMTAAVGFPTLRLVRYQVDKITINDLLVGEVKEFQP